MSVNTLAIEAVARAGAIPSPPSRDDSIAGLTKYIPTESLTLYVATVSAQTALHSVAPWLTPSLAYKVFVGLTPALMLILFLRKLAVAGQEWRLPPKSWPWWGIVASTIAFAVWALAVPGNPVISQTNEAGGVVAAFAALLVSTALNLVAPFFEKVKPAQAPGGGPQ